MAENSNIYYGSGIIIPGNLDIGAIGLPADSRVMVKNHNGLDELITERRVYDGMIVYVEQDIDGSGAYYTCHVTWDSESNITNCAWKKVELLSEDELTDLIAHNTTAAMEFKGTIDKAKFEEMHGAPDAPPKPRPHAQRGDFYKVVEDFTIPAICSATGEDVNVYIGDSIVYGDTDFDQGGAYGGNGWYVIPSGDDIEDTWRVVKVNNEVFLEGGNTTNPINFKAGDNVTLSTNADGTLTISAKDDNSHHEAKMVVTGDPIYGQEDSATDLDNGEVYLNIVEHNELRSSHLIEGTDGAKVKWVHETIGEGEEVKTIGKIVVEAPEVEDTDTHRPIFVNGSEILTDATGSSIDFRNGHGTTVNAYYGEGLGTVEIRFNVDIVGDNQNITVNGTQDEDDSQHISLLVQHELPDVVNATPVPTYTPEEPEKPNEPEIPEVITQIYDDPNGHVVGVNRMTLANIAVSGSIYDVAESNETTREVISEETGEPVVETITYLVLDCNW